MDKLMITNADLSVASSLLSFLPSITLPFLPSYLPLSLSLFLRHSLKQEFRIWWWMNKFLICQGRIPWPQLQWMPYNHNSSHLRLLGSIYVCRVYKAQSVSNATHPKLNSWLPLSSSSSWLICQSKWSHFLPSPPNPEAAGVWLLPPA